MERVTVEQNGERITLEVPEGTTDEQIQQFLGSQPAAKELPPAGIPQAVSVANQVGQELMPAVAPVMKDVAGTAANVVKGSVQDIGSLAKVATQITPAAAGDFLKKTLQSPVEMTSKTIGAYVEGHPYLGKVTQSSLSSAGADALNYAKNIASKMPSPGAIGGAAVRGLVAPESLLMAPYQMAAYEQEKIRQNPTAPGLEKNPYAMSVRSEGGPAPITQGQAGAMNRRNVIANMPYGNVTAEERAILDQDRIRREQQQIKARQVLQQPPTAQNYIERMKALSTLYSPVNEK